jgi:hypothetical protein
MRCYSVNSLHWQCLVNPIHRIQGAQKRDVEPMVIGVIFCS